MHEIPSKDHTKVTSPWVRAVDIAIPMDFPVFMECKQGKGDFALFGCTKLSSFCIPFGGFIIFLFKLLKKGVVNQGGTTT